MTVARSVASIDSFEVILDHFLTYIERCLSQSYLRFKKRTKQGLFLDVMASNYFNILSTPNTTFLFINIPTECKMCCTAEVDFVRKIVDLNAKYVVDVV